MFEQFAINHMTKLRDRTKRNLDTAIRNDKPTIEVQNIQYKYEIYRYVVEILEKYETA